MSIAHTIPPLEEQHRIVAKIEELLPYIEAYEKAETQLSTLNTTFPEMLKKSILQEAVQGKLVSQNPDDEPASVLLERIQAEKQELIRAGKIKKSKHESIIITRDKIPYDISDGKERCIADEVPFELPESWCWCRLGSIIQIESGKGLTSKQMIQGSIPVYGGNGITGYHNETLVHKETIVIGRVGYYCGSIHITEKEAWITDNAFITTYPENNIYREYLVYTLKYMNLGKNNNATAQPVVSGKKIYPMLFPLPPLAEQKRIVEKIEELMKYCDML
ncbi:MAG: restriction endonuclease subunit S [Alistipes senegalensis]|nr:restriction endonuclease subunit S [Alistipes senegalensis]